VKHSMIHSEKRSRAGQSNILFYFYPSC